MTVRPKNKIGAMSALAALMMEVGMPTSALGHEIAQIHQHCEDLVLIEDPIFLQQRLEELLERDPSNACIGVIVGLLGGEPIAQNPEIY